MNPDHVLLKVGACGMEKEYHGENDWRSCPVCEGGLSVCSVCGTYEAGLDGPCVPAIEWKTVGRFSEVAKGPPGLIGSVWIDAGHYRWEVCDSAETSPPIRCGVEPTRESAKVAVGRAMLWIEQGCRPMINPKDYRDAVNGIGPLAGQWADKKHRLVYDLCAAIEGGGFSTRYLSDRGISLVYQGRQGSLTRKMLTVESYIKWYYIFAVSPDGTVEALPDEVAREYDDRQGESGGVPWSEHVPAPDFCRWIVDTYPEYEWDEPSLDMIYGRWHRREIERGTR